MRHYTYLLLIIFLLSGCAAKKVSVGRGDVEGEFRQCLALYSKGKFEDAIGCMEMFKARYPKSEQGQEAELKIGDAQFGKKEYLIAAESYNAFLQLYPGHPKADYAHYKAGLSYYKESPKSIDRDQEYLDNAIDHLRVVLRRYPGCQYTEAAAATLRAALNRQARRHFYIGRFYYRTGEYLAAVPRFEEVVNNYAQSGLAEKSLLLMIKSDIKLNKLEDAREAYGILSSNFPGGRAAKSAEAKLLSAAKKK